MVALKIALRSLARRGGSVALLVLPSALLFGMVTFFVATRGAVRQLLEPGVEARAFRVGSSEAASDQAAQFFTQGDVARLGAVPHVKVAPATFEQCGTDKNDLFELNCGSTNAAYVEIWDADIRVPAAERERWDGMKNGAIITRTAADRHHWQVGSHLILYRGDAPDAPPLELEVSYITDKFIDATMVYYHLEYLTHRYPEVKPSFWVVWGLVDRADERQAIMDEWDLMLNGVRPHIVSTMESSKQALLNGSRLLREAFQAAGVLSLILVVCLALALLTLVIEQRRTELAALLAIGFRRGMLARSVLLEGLLTLTPAALIGSFALWLPFHDDPLVFEAIFRVTVHLSDVWETVACGAAVGLFSAAIPAWRVYRLDILGALR